MRTNNDSAHITELRRFYKQKSRLPTYKELLTITGFSSRSSVFSLISRLSAMGILAKDRNGTLSPSPKFFERERLGIVEAGFGYDTDAILDDPRAIDDFLIEKPEATFLLKVKGESMIEAGILPGDIVIAERSTDAKNGKIIIAEVDGAWTIKYYRLEKGKHLLIPANRAMKPMSPSSSFRVAAIVKGVIRKYS